jgi:hypothetical protein
MVVSSYLRIHVILASFLCYADDLVLSVTFKTILLVLLSDKTLREAGDGGGAAKVGPGDLRQLHHERIALSHTRNEMPPFLLLRLVRYLRPGLFPRLFD